MEKEDQEDHMMWRGIEKGFLNIGPCCRIYGNSGVWILVVIFFIWRNK